MLRVPLSWSGLSFSLYVPLPCCASCLHFLYFPHINLKLGHTLQMLTSCWWKVASWVTLLAPSLYILCKIWRSQMEICQPYGCCIQSDTVTGFFWQPVVSALSGRFATHPTNARSKWLWVLLRVFWRGSGQGGDIPLPKYNSMAGKICAPTTQLGLNTNKT